MTTTMKSRTRRHTAKFYVDQLEDRVLLAPSYMNWTFDAIQLTTTLNRITQQTITNEHIFPNYNVGVNTATGTDAHGHTELWALSPGGTTINLYHNGAWTTMPATNATPNIAVGTGEIFYTTYDGNINYCKDDGTFGLINPPSNQQGMNVHLYVGQDAKGHDELWLQGPANYLGYSNPLDPGDPQFSVDCIYLYHNNTWTTINIPVTGNLPGFTVAKGEVAYAHVTTAYDSYGTITTVTDTGKVTSTNQLTANFVVGANNTIWSLEPGTDGTIDTNITGRWTNLGPQSQGATNLSAGTDAQGRPELWITNSTGQLLKYDLGHWTNLGQAIEYHPVTTTQIKTITKVIYEPVITNGHTHLVPERVTEQVPITVTTQVPEYVSVTSITATNTGSCVVNDGQWEDWAGEYANGNTFLVTNNYTHNLGQISNITIGTDARGYDQLWYITDTNTITTIDTHTGKVLTLTTTNNIAGLFPATNGEAYELYSPLE